MNKLQEQLENSHKCELENTIKRSNNVRSLYCVGDKFFLSFFSFSLVTATASKCERIAHSIQCGIVFML